MKSTKIKTTQVQKNLQYMPLWGNKRVYRCDIIFNYNLCTFSAHPITNLSVQGNAFIFLQSFLAHIICVSLQLKLLLNFI